MAASLKDIAGWWETGKAEGAAYMIVVCDTFDYDDYPHWVMPTEDFWKIYDDYDGKSMQRIMEVYDFSKPWASQSTGRVYNTPPRATHTSDSKREPT